MSLLVPCPEFPCILVFMVIPDWADGFDIYKYEYICFPCAFSLVLILRPVLCFSFSCFLMISAREETWRYLFYRFLSLCLFVLHCLLVRALCFYSTLLIHFGPCGRYIGSSQGSFSLSFFFFLLRFRVSCLNMGVCIPYHVVYLG